MPYTTVVPSTTITAAWGNTNVRDQVVTPFATAAARDSAITSPVDGMICYLADSDTNERYKASTGWRRLDWNDAWGVVGGKQWTTNTTLAAGLSTSEALCNMDTGPVTLLPGRLYAIRVRINFFTGNVGANWILFKVRRTGLTGALAMDSPRYQPQSNSFGVTPDFSGIMPNLGANPVTDTWYVTGARFSGSDNFTVNSGTATDKTYVFIEDMGPSSGIVTI